MNKEMMQEAISQAAASKSCPHGQIARTGCVPCYEETLFPDTPQHGMPPEPMGALTEVWVHFTTTAPLPDNFLRDMRGYHPRIALAIAGPLKANTLAGLDETSNLYMLGGAIRTESLTQAIAAAVGFLTSQVHAVGEFTVLETEAGRP